MGKYEHDITVDSLARRLHNKGRYFAVAKEVPYFNLGLTLEKGRLDVFTVDKRNHRLIYWEVKTGLHSHGWKKAKYQARNFYKRLERNVTYDNWDAQFVYYNPSEHIVKRIKREDVL